jgi:SOS-response transcriptional repressor LexA
MTGVYEIETEDAAVWPAARPFPSDRQTAILRFIADFRVSHRHGPTIREIGIGVDLVSPSSVQYQLGLLRDAGLVVFTGRIGSIANTSAGYAAIGITAGGAS